MLKISELFDFSYSLAGEYLSDFQNPWDALSGIKKLIVEIGKSLPNEEYAEISPEIWVHKTAVISPTAFIGSPCIIDAETQVRHCAFIRGAALAGKNCVIGNSTELKNVILFDGVQVPHYNYVGDSILGYKAHMGAGSITSNVKSDKSLVTVKEGKEKNETNLKKFGAIIGDNVEIGCNTVLNPGTLIGRNSIIYPLSCVRGIVPPDSIYKTGGIIIKKENR